MVFTKSNIARKRLVLLDKGLYYTAISEWLATAPANNK